MQKFRNYIIYTPLSYSLDIIYSSSDNISRIINGQRKTRGEGLNKIKRYLEKNVVVEIPNGKWRSVKAIQSAKLSNHLGIVAQYFLTLPNQGKELKIEEKDAASQTEIVSYTYFFLPMHTFL